MVGTVTARMSVLPDVDSELPVDSDGAAVVCTALLDEALDDALDVVGLHVGQLWFQTELEDVLPVMLDEHSLMCDFVWPDVVPANQDFVATMVCGDDRLSPGVRNDVSMDWRIDLDSHGMVNWEYQLNGEDRAFAGASDWKSVLRCVACLSRLPEFPDRDCLKCFDDIGNNCIMDFNAWGTCPQVRTPGCSLETCARTLPTRQECLGSDVPSGTVAQLRGCTQMRGCAECGCSPGEIGCAEDWGYIRPATNDEWPVRGQPVTGSLLFGSPLRLYLLISVSPVVRSGGSQCRPG